MSTRLKNRLKGKIEDKARNYIRKKSAAGDERIAFNAGNAAAITLYITYSFIIIIAFYKILTNKNFLSETILIFLIPLVFTIAQKKTKGYSPLPPKSTNGTLLNTENSKEGKKSRLKTYIIDALKDAIFFLISFYVINLLSGNKSFYKEPNFIISSISTILFCFIIFFIFSYFGCEKKVKKYNKYIEALDNED